MSRAAGAGYERVAAAWLERRGFRILDTNYTCKGGELDLVCDDGGTLVFVEVRARSGRHAAAAETISWQKRRRLVHAARHYLARRRLDDAACRFDVVAIDGDVVTHLPNAFDSTE